MLLSKAFTQQIYLDQNIENSILEMISKNYLVVGINSKKSLRRKAAGSNVRKISAILKLAIIHAIHCISHLNKKSCGEPEVGRGVGSLPEIR